MKLSAKSLKVLGMISLLIGCISIGFIIAYNWRRETTMPAFVAVGLPFFFCLLSMFFLKQSKKSNNLK